MEYTVKNYDDWYCKYEDDIMAGLAETGADREMDFNLEEALENQYQAYVDSVLDGLLAQYDLYLRYACHLEEPDYDIHIEDIDRSVIRVMTVEEFILRLRNDSTFQEIHRGTVKLMD